MSNALRIVIVAFLLCLLPTAIFAAPEAAAEKTATDGKQPRLTVLFDAFGKVIPPKVMTARAER